MKLPLFQVMSPLLACGWLLSSAGPAAAESANAATLQRLESLRKSYEAAVATQAGGPLPGLKTLDAGYLDTLTRQIGTASKDGRLDDAVALQAEKTRVQSGGPFPETDAGAPLPVLRLRATYRSGLAKLTAARTKLTAPLRERYAGDLQALETTLTKAGSLDDALAVQAVRKAFPESDLTETSKPSAAKAGGRTDAKAAEEICRWALANQATVETDAGVVGTGPGAKLTTFPQARFRVLGITSGGTGAFPWDLLKGLPELITLKLESPELPTPAECQTLAGLPALTTLQLADAARGPALTMDLLKALPLLPRLEEFTFRADADLPGLLTALHPHAPNLTRLRIFGMGSGNSADSCARLLKWPRLASHFLQGNPDAAAIASLAKLKDLHHLMFYTGSEDLDPAVLAPLRQIGHLSLNGKTKSQDLLQRLSALPGLTELDVDLEGQPAASLTELTKLPALKTLRLENLSGEVLAADAAKILGSLKGLTALHLTSFDLTDAGLPSLESLRSLTELKLIRTQVTPAAARAFMKSRPRCKVML